MEPVDTMHAAVIGEDIAFACHFMATHLYSTLWGTSGIGCASKNYLKWQQIQLAIHSKVDEQTDYK